MPRQPKLASAIICIHAEMCPKELSRNEVGAAIRNDNLFEYHIKGKALEKNISGQLNRLAEPRRGREPILNRQEGKRNHYRSVKDENRKHKKVFTRTDTTSIRIGSGTEQEINRFLNRLKDKDFAEQIRDRIYKSSWARLTSNFVDGIIDDPAEPDTLTIDMTRAQSEKRERCPTCGLVADFQRKRLREGFDSWEWNKKEPPGERLRFLESRNEELTYYLSLKGQEKFQQEINKNLIEMSTLRKEMFNCQCSGSLFRGRVVSG